MEQAKQEAETVYERAREKVQPVPPMAPPVAENPRPYRSYEDLAPKVFSWEKPDEARMAAKRAEQRQEKVFKAYTQESAPVSRYAKLLRNPQSAREAIILSEIFNRKHF
ncbi:MAG: hypothetical protein LPK14_13485 [Hymenobacteraceae bacterium]|nr:hypothetical protein [Hymenobacteraceae bacterium]